MAEETSPIFPLITAETWSDGDDGSWSGRRSRMQLLRLIGGQCYFGVLMALVQLDMEESKDTIMLDLTAEMAFWKKAEC